jgi:hypothetical protein
VSSLIYSDETVLPVKQAVLRTLRAVALTFPRESGSKKITASASPDKSRFGGQTV